MAGIRIKIQNMNQVGNLNSISNIVVKIILGSMLALGVWSCKSTPKEAPPAESAGGEGQSQKEPVVEKAPLKFDPAGSDSGQINGLSTVHFDYDKSSLSGEEKKKIQGNVDWMKANPKVSVQIEGHCDSRGSIEYNLALGERRANAVKSYMMSLGVGKDRLKTISYGEEKPLVSGESESAWAKNRRANFLPLSE